MTIELTENTFIELDSEWTQLFNRFNWYTFTLIEVYFENDKFTGGHEYVVSLLGFSLRIRHNTPEFYRKREEWKKDLEEVI